MRVFVGLASLWCLAGCPGSSSQPPRDVPFPTRQLAVVLPDGTVQVTWKNPEGIARTVVGRFGPGAEVVDPTVTPKAGDALGEGQVVGVGLDEALVDGSPPRVCGVVTYRLWSQSEAGLWSTTPVLAELPAGATFPVPTEGVTQLAASLDAGTIALSWVNPSSSTGFFQTALVRKLGSAPRSKADGQLVRTTQGAEFQEPSGPFAAGSEVFYAATTCNQCGACREPPVTTSVTLPSSDAGANDGGAFADAGVISDAGLAPTAFTATVSTDGQQVVLTWLNGPNPALTGVRIARTLTEGVSTGPAVTVFEGSATTASERVDGLLPSTVTTNRTYTYTATGCASGTCEASGPTTTVTLTLRQALRGGGYSLFWRHASADVCADKTNLCPSNSPSQTCAQAVSATSAADWWKTCVSDAPTCATSARQLNAVAAPNETHAVRTWFQTNGVSVGRVATSEYCRCFQTAQQFMFGPSLEYSQDLTYFVYDEALRCAKTLALLNQAPAAGTNSAFVGHAGFVCPTLDSLAWAEAAIYKPQIPTTRTCTTVGSCANDEACVAGLCAKPLLIARVPALGVASWSTLP